MNDRVQLVNHYSLKELLEKMRQVLMATQRDDALALLDKAIAKASCDASYEKEMEEALLYGSTIELRELLSAFGDYFGPPNTEFPFYPHTDAVNGIDSVMGAIKFNTIKPGHLKDHIEFVNLMRS
ncbi:hypothetical protein TUM3794_19830 [Shewanella colwelliana]|uniref:Uncharacterized protein n=1 Tax=Shewanella colwelliana TaxID=23 RepID=A0ABQ4P0E4_SHECO|nr:hypothetical protein [Shewanella colwelliana]GIU40875.1 hypothetical protein TUM3794_19830 [Shewanella colwelliana]